MKHALPIWPTDGALLTIIILPEHTCLLETDPNPYHYTITRRVYVPPNRELDFFLSLKNTHVRTAHHTGTHTRTARLYIYICICIQRTGNPLVFLITIEETHSITTVYNTRSGVYIYTYYNANK